MHPPFGIDIGFLLVSLLGASARAQDWPKEIERACTGKRLGLQIAASNKVANGGALAALAVREYAKQLGRNALSSTLVNAIATNPKKPEEMLVLLTEWARDKDFYWRAQALAGLARPDNERLLEQRALFLAATHDPAHLYRVQGARGLIALGTRPDRERARALLDDPDPRARRAVAEMLADSGDKSALPTLVTTLQRGDLEFLGDPWGRREARLAFDALKRALGAAAGAASASTGSGYDPDRSVAENRASIEALAKLAGAEAPAPVVAPAAPRKDRPAESRPESPLAASAAASPTAFEGQGFEIRSCKHGDLFVRFSDAGKIVLGLLGDVVVTLPEAEASQLASVRKAVTPRPNGMFGVVICDFVRYLSPDPAVHWQCAPGSLPDDLMAVLKTLAASLEKSNQRELAEQMRLRIQQFAPRDSSK